jgi:lipoprotein-anchoring transpeptidase ErfK/SrfK
MSTPRFTLHRALHVVTAVTCALGIFVALQPSGRDARAMRETRVAAAAAPTTTTFAIESFAPADVPDTFEVQPVAPRITMPPTTTTLAPAKVPAARASPTTQPELAIADVPADAQLVARLVRTAAVYDQPGGTRATRALAATTEFGTPRVLPVVQQGGDWLLVQLPTRPNGATGWIRSRDAVLDTRADRVDVDLATRTLVWTRRGVVQLVAPVAIGAPASPTPPGDMFVTDVLPATPGSEYGAWVIALDAHSDAFTEFEGGDPRIAIHGTNDPSSIGRAVSAGCVRVDDATLATLAGAFTPGTVVVVH